MSGWSVVRWTGVLGLAAIVVQVVAVVIGSAAGSAPAIDDATKLLAYVRNSHFAATTVLMLFFIGFALFLGFSAGLRAIAVAASPEQEWLATTTFGAGVVIAGIGFAGLGVGLTALAIAGWIGSILVFIAASSGYGTSDPAAFWAANGIVTVLAFLPFWIWTLGASVVFLRQS